MENLRANRYNQILQLKERIENCVRGAAIATENKYSTEQLNPTYAEVYAGETGTTLIHQIMEESGLSLEDDALMNGSSDVGNVNLSIPVIYPVISVGKDVPLYSAELAECMKTAAGSDAMHKGALVTGKALVHLASHPEDLERIKQEHEQYRLSI